MREWVRCRRGFPCPICGREDWCMIHADGTAAACCRVQDGAARRRDGSIIELGGDDGGMGWVHRLVDRRGDLKPIRVPRTPKPKPEVEIDWDRLVAEYERGLDADRLREIAGELELDEEAVDISGVGWSGLYWTWPMYDPDGSVCGIRTRSRDGGKRAVKGSRNGIFMPRLGQWGDILAITEGASDMAAAIQLGMYAVGRHSALGGRDAIERMLSRINWKGAVVILSDRDGPGWNGAQLLADHLADMHDVRLVVVPRGKDVRRWVSRHKATRAELDWIITNTSRRRRTASRGG